MDYFSRYNSSGVYTIYETDEWDPFADDRLRLYWDHPAFPGQWSLRFCYLPIGPDEEPEQSCLSCPEEPWPRDALARHFGFDGCLAWYLPAEQLFRMSPEELSGGRVRQAPASRTAREEA